jgi:protein TonB
MAPKGEMEEFSLSGPAQRLLLALTVSVALHLALIFLVKIVPVKTSAAKNVVIEVRLEEASPPAVKAAITALTQKQSANPLPAEEPAKPAEPPKPVEQKPASAPATQAEEKSLLPSVEVPLVEDPTFYPAKQVDIHPKVLAPVNPVFPDKAANDNVSGEVTLLLMIDEAGKVRDLAVVDAKPEAYFEDSALNAFRNTRWAPAQKDGRIVKSRVLIRVRYELGSDGGSVGF